MLSGHTAGEKKDRHVAAADGEEQEDGTEEEREGGTDRFHKLFVEADDGQRSRVGREVSRSVLLKLSEERLDLLFGEVVADSGLEAGLYLVRVGACGCLQGEIDIGVVPGES